MKDWNYDYDTEAMSKALVGRRIVAASDSEGKLVLDDGTTLLIDPNEGCGGCSSGNYGIESLATFDNIITRVELTDERDDCEDRLEVHVYAEGASAVVAAVTGDEGNGYYGRGYRFMVVPA